MNQGTPRLEGRGLSRSFPGVKALDGVDIRLGAGEVLAVIGENGAGKSTLMKILAGLQPPDGGQILYEGSPLALDGPAAATRAGIALIHQELNLAGNLDIAANIFLGREKRRWGFFDEGAQQTAAATLMARIGLDMPPSTLVDRLAIGQQQLVEIAKALSYDARVLIMDEPTSSLSQTESARLFAAVDDLKRQGVSIIYISHRLGEVQALADRVAVLRDGRNAGELVGDAITHDAMVRLMVGRDLSQFYVRSPHRPGDTVLRAAQIVTPAWPGHAIDFSLRRGEVVGLAGLVGSGRSELLQVLFGIDSALAGQVILEGRTVPPASPRAAIDAGMALIPEDRKEHGLVLTESVRHNIGLPGLHRHQGMGGLLDRQREENDAEAMRRDLGIKTPHLDQAVRFLSGGNQQKTVLGKWLALAPRVLLLDEPTRGVDIGAKREIYALMDRLAADGVAILFASSEMEEILGMADRVLVMHEGGLSGELSRDALSEEAVMRLATGRDRDQAA